MILYRCSHCGGFTSRRNLVFTGKGAMTPCPRSGNLEKVVRV